MTASTTAANNKGQASALDPRTLFMIVAAICFLALLLWFMLHFKARQQQIQDLNDQIESSTTQLNDLQTKQSQLPTLRQDVAKLKEGQQRFVQALPPTAEIGKYIADLRDSVTSSGGSIDSLATSPSSNNGNLPSGVQPIDITLKMNGRFTPVYQTLQTIETLGRFTKIRDVNIALPAANDTDPELAGVINLTTYTFDPASVAPAAAPAGSAPAAAPAAPAAQGGKS